VDEGNSVVMISSELPEILGMCDRVFVMDEGKMVVELDKGEADQETIMSHILQNKGA
jgi:putative multiple sugar transport system ATP-binding protein